MSTWEHPDKPEWQEIQAELRGHGSTPWVRARRPRARVRRVNWMRLFVSYMSLFAAFLLTYDFWTGLLAGWAAGLGVVLAGVCMYICERWS